MGHRENESRELRSSIVGELERAICQRVSEVVEAVDARVKRAELN